MVFELKCITISQLVFRVHKMISFIAFEFLSHIFKNFFFSVFLEGKEGPVICCYTA